MILPARISAWMGVEWLGGETSPREGSPFDYRFATTAIESRGRVLRFEPPRVLEHSWFENLPPPAIIRWSLEPDGEGCILTLTDRAGPPEDGPRAAAGWRPDGGVETTLAGEATAFDQPRWAALRQVYAATL